ncbi:CgeB family protein [Paenibacillus cymbidii]|uniref:CgeB family protein n=1 Tax=Paenibacillus cymbidii TaxID=1639034 RepID=UPI0010802888|nr:glycosyltransferase [Paenibacillus cymbidii]
MHGAVAAAYGDGQAAGFRDGYAEGRRLGLCESVIRHIELPPEKRYDLHVLYVEEGLFALNEGIKDGLSGLVRQLTCCHPRQITAEKIAEMKPDLVIVLNGIHEFPAEQAARVRSYGIPTAVWFADDPYFTDVTANIARQYDFVFTHELSCIPFYRSAGCKRVFHLPLAAAPVTFHPKRTDPKYRSDICFIGTAFWNRVRFFDKLAPYLIGKRLVMAGGLWNRLKQYDRMAGSIILAGVPLAESVHYYNGAKIVINLHRSTDDGEHNRNSLGLPGLSINPRTFEISACGTLQLTDIRPDLRDYYTPGYDIETYESESELISKIDYYLQHDDQRLTIAARGLRQTLGAHTYHGRLIRLLDTMLLEGNRV